MKELNEKELDQINGGVTTPDDTDLSGIRDFFKKIGERIKKVGPKPEPTIKPTIPTIFTNDK